MIQFLILLVSVIHAVTRGTMYCREARDPNTPEIMAQINQCWEDGFATAFGASNCLPTSGETVCRCAQNEPEECDLLDVWESSNQQLVAYCEDRVVFIPKKIENGIEVDDVSNQFAVCKKMIRLNNWAPYTREGSGRPEEKYSHNWRSTARFRCWWNGDYTWRNNKCLDEQRYINEECWHGVACEGSSTRSDGYMLSCLSTLNGGNQCMPSIMSRKRPQCECGFLQPWVWFACGAADDVCNGHSCVLSTQNGKRYCDYYSYHVGSWGTLGQG